MKKLFLIAIVVVLAGAAGAQDTPNQDPSSQSAGAGKAAQTPTTQTFSDYEIGMAFDYPSTWVLVTDPKEKKTAANLLDNFLGKKHKEPIAPGKQAHGETLFYVPAGSHTANLEIYGALWDQTPDLWESVQQDAAKNLKRTVDKQWREEILGVPLLLTKLSYDDGTGPQVALSGLVYSRTPYKLQFILSAPADNYDAAEAALRDVLQTLRTTSGALPVPEDPNHPLDKTAYENVVDKAPTQIVMTAPNTDASKARKGPVAVPAAVSGRKVVLTLPAGWTADVASDGSISLRNPSVAGAASIILASTLDSDPADAALMKSAAGSLDLFSKVEERSEAARDFSAAGASTDKIWRTGAGDNGPLTTCDASGATGEFYWILSYRQDGNLPPSERKLIDALIDGMSVDPQP